MSLSKNRIKYIQSLKDKKHRSAHGTFVAEGRKIVFDLLKSCKCQLVTGEREIIAEMDVESIEEKIIASEDELKKASFLKTPPEVIGVFYQSENKITLSELDSNIHLILDGIQDPGNMGTIMRLADWFGIEHIFCSPDTVDIYNPKTVQATMGAIARIKTYYTNLSDFLQKNEKLPIYGTFLEGENIYESDLKKNGFIIMGNEGRGIRPEIIQYVNHKLFIPNFPPDRNTSESLNVAIATAIVCSEFRRSEYKKSRM